jgi:hypothetical protein
MEDTEMANYELAARAALRFRKDGNAHLAAVAANLVTTHAPAVSDLIREAGKLNNSPTLVGTDHVSIMGMMDHAEMVLHVAKLRDLAA